MVNIAEILRNIPNNHGMKLWSNVIGNCLLKNIKDDGDIIIERNINSYTITFTDFGEFSYNSGLCNLFPSQKMQDWEKMAWKRGDVMTCGANRIIFSKWTNNEYTRFEGCYYNVDNPSESDYDTSAWVKATEDQTKEYIEKIEKAYGGRLNLDTLGIEKSEFKDGDIVTLHKKDYDTVFIFNRWKTEDSFYYYAFHMYNSTGIIDKGIRLPYEWTYVDGKLSIATDSEKQQLFDALAKKGKAWDADKKLIVDLPKTCEFEPFQKVLARSSKDSTWKADFFSHYDKQCNKPYCCVGNIWMMYCIPYNEETKHLLGTNDEWKGGKK